MSELVCIDSSNQDFVQLSCEVPETVPFSPENREVAAETAIPRSVLLQDAFSAGLARPVAQRWGSPLTYTPLVMFPAGCANESSMPNASGNDSGSAGTDSGTTTPPMKLPPFLAGFELFANAPCGTEGILTDLDENLGACANYTTGNHHLFSWDPQTPGSIASIIPLSYPPDQVLRTSDGIIFTTTYQNPGLAVTDPILGTESHVPFPTTVTSSRPTSGGRMVSSFAPNYAKGLVEIGNRILVASSNYDLAHGDFHPGTVLAYDHGTGGFQTWETSGYNPTSVANVSGSLLVVSTGALSATGAAGTDSYLDLFDPATGTRTNSLHLGRYAAGVSGEMSVSGDGSTLVLPTADNSGKLIVVNLLNFSFREISLRDLGVSGGRIFFPSIQLTEDGNYALVGNFNDGKLYVVDLESGSLASPALTLDTNLLDGVGISDGLRVGGEFFIGKGDSILRLNLRR